MRPQAKKGKGVIMSGQEYVFSLLSSLRPPAARELTDASCRRMQRLKRGVKYGWDGHPVGFLEPQVKP